MPRRFGPLVFSLLCYILASPLHAQDLSVTALTVHEEGWDLFGYTTERPIATEIAKPDPTADFPYLPDEPYGRSFSMGTVTDGWLVRGVALPLPSATLSVLPRQHRRGLLYGTQELVEALTDAADFVSEVHPGSVLWMGNVGRSSGGDIPWSVSHNSGRDADLAFYTTDPEGRLVAPPDLLHYDDRGRSREYGGYYRFDVARNWTLVKALLLSSEVQIQYLFISNGLRAQLISHARERGEPAALIEHAQRVLMQPGPEIPHDDHLHIRVYCSRADMSAGCENTGRTQPGVDLFTRAREARIEQAIGMLRAGESETRARATERLTLLDARGELGAIRRRLSDPSPRVRAAAVRAIGHLGEESNVGWLVEAWETEADPYVREAIVRGVGELGGRNAADFLAAFLAVSDEVVIGGKQYDLRIVAADMAIEVGRAESVPALVEMLGHPDSELRHRAARALRHLTNHAVSPELDWYSADETSIADARGQWMSWWEERGGDTRGEWLATGFSAAGYTVSGRARDRAATLAVVAGHPNEWVRDNAQRELMRMTGNQPRSLIWSRFDAQTYWTRWVRRNPGRIRG